MGVVHQDVVHRVAVFTDGDSLQLQSVEHETLIAVLTEDHLLAVAEEDGAFGTHLAIRDARVGAVVEDDAVYEHLRHGSATVAGRCSKDGRQVGRVRIDATGEEVAACAEGQLGRDEGILHRAVGRALGDEAAVGRRGVLSLGEAVDLVVHQHDVQIYVAAYGVDEVVTTDGEAVAVAGDEPNADVGACRLDAGSDGRATAVNGVEAVSVHVVRQTRGAADTRDDGHIIGRGADFGHRFMQAAKHGVVAASGTPANVLIALVVFGAVGYICCCVHN